jgi:uncharacterized membrane protein YkoI
MGYPSVMSKRALIPASLRVKPWLPALLLAAAAFTGAVAPVAAAAVTLEQAVAQVRRETGGRILQAETVQEQGRRVHRIKVLTPQRSVRTLRIDAGNGR